MKFEKYLFLFFVGGAAYYCLEIISRGYSHYSMFLCGGLCFIGCGILNESVKIEMSLISQMVLSSLLITALEFITGCIVNLWLGWKVWDYSRLPYNFKGQICLIFSVAWFFLSLAAILLDDYLRYKLFDEEKPYYKIL
ncbi:MAG: hypothetical protein Q4E73_10225 [Lachnospiraceae bacterium]|nr:hypothetical protein [Lachnospiraceae bacterium]